MMVMKSSIAKVFNETIEDIIPDEDVRETLYDSLKEYQSQHDLVNLLRALREIINEPDRIQIYDDIRPLIPLKHQVLYDRLTPAKPSEKLRVIRLSWKSSGGLGFSIRGGLEHGTGVYVSQISSDCQAFHQGLRVGDEIVRLNGFTISLAIHEEVINLIRSREELVLKVRHVGMIPVKDHVDVKVSWRYIENLDPNTSLVLDGNSTMSKNGEHREVKVFLNVGAASGLGCSILSGTPARPGIFIQAVRLGSLAQEVGLEVGDQITEVNANNLNGASHAEAVYLLKESKQLHLSVKKGAGKDLFHSRPQQVLTPPDEEEEKAIKLQQLSLQQNQQRTIVQDPEGSILEKEIIEQKTQESLAIAAVQEKLATEKTPVKNIPVKTKEEKPAAELPEKKVKTTVIHKREPAKQAEKIGATSCSQQKPELQPEVSHTASSSRISPGIAQSQHPGQTKQKEHEENSEQFKRENTQIRQPSFKTNIPKDRPDQSNLQALGSQQEILVEQKQKPTPTKPTRSVQKATEQHKEPDLHATPVVLRSATYMSGEKKPSFRIQKPVLLSPMPKSPDSHKRSRRDSRGVIYEEEDDHVEISNTAEVNPNMLFTNEEIDGRPLKVINLKKDGPLDMSIEAGSGHGQKGIFVSDIFSGGIVHRQGEIACGDEILMIDDKSLTNVSLSQAHNILKDSLLSKKQILKLVVAKSTDDDEFEEQITHL